MIKKYYTAFCYEGIHPVDLHCTHKYLGELTDDQVWQVRSVINNRLKRFLVPGETDRFRLNFNQEELFGPNKNIRVLTCAKTWIPPVFDTLRQDLDAFRKDDYFPFVLHVTTSFKQINATFTRYVLVSGGEIVEEWYLR